jgi:hypothetical protein
MRLALISILVLSGCGLGALSQNHAQSRISGAEKITSLSDAGTSEDECQFTVDPAAGALQEATCTKSDASILIPAGALAIPATVAVSQQGDIYAALAASGVSFVPAGSAVSVTAGENSQLSSPMTITLPVSGGTGLASFENFWALDERAEGDYSVVHKCFGRKCESDAPEILTDVRGSIRNGKFSFKTNRLGVFQLMLPAKTEDLLPPQVKPESGEFDLPVKAVINVVDGVSYRYTLGNKERATCKDSKEYADFMEVLSNGAISFLSVVACRGSQQSEPTRMKYRIKPPAQKLMVCGGPKTGSCYDVAEKKLNMEAMIEDTNFIVHLADLGSCADASVDCLIWREGLAARPGSRILNANGHWVSDRAQIWQKKLFPGGNFLRGLDFLVDNRVSPIVGRVCPPAVYLDKNLASSCLYYDGGNPEQRLDAMSSDRSKESLIDYLTSWMTPSVRTPMWFHGNINVCSSKGMRLPTLFETTVEAPLTKGPAEPKDLTMGGRLGVPPISSSASGASTWTWTATGISSAETTGNFYGVWGANGASQLEFSVSANVRCVLPSNQ